PLHDALPILAEPPPSATPIRGPSCALILPRSAPFMRSLSASALPRRCSGVGSRGGGAASKTVRREFNPARLRKGSALFPGDLAPADIAPAEALRPVNLVHAVVSTLLCLSDRSPERGD